MRNTVYSHVGFKAFRREISFFFSRPVYAVVSVLIPLFCFLFFATLMPEGLPSDLPLGVVDRDQSVLSRNILRQIEATQSCRITTRFSDPAEALAAMQTAEVFGYLEIPENLEQNIYNGNQPDILLYYNQSYLIAGSLVLKDVSTALTTISAGMRLKVRLAKGLAKQQALTDILPYRAEIHPIGNPWINYSVYLINVIIPGLLHLMVLLTTVLVIGMELKERRTANWFTDSNAAFAIALSGKLLPYTLIFFAQGFLMNIILFGILGYPLHTSLIWMLLATGGMILAAQAVGVLMIGVFPVLRIGLSFAGLYGMLAFSYSGLSFPIEGMPAPLQGLSIFFPLRHYFILYQKLALNGFEVVSGMPAFACLLMFTALPLIILRRLRSAIIHVDFTGN